MSTSDSQINSYHNDHLSPHNDNKDIQQSIRPHSHIYNKEGGSNTVVISYENESRINIDQGKAKEQQPTISEDFISATISPLDGRESWIVLTGLFMASIFTGLHSTW